MHYDETDGYVITPPPAEAPGGWGYDRRVVGHIVEVREDWTAYRYLQSFEPGRNGHKAPMPMVRRVRLILDAEPRKVGRCHECAEPVVELRCAWPSLDGYELRRVRLQVDPDTLEGYHSEHIYTVHAADHTTHGGGSLMLRAECSNCGAHERDQFTIEHLPYHDRATCKACGHSTTSGSIGD